MAVKAFTTTMSFDIEISGEAPKRTQAVAEKLKEAEKYQEALNRRLKEYLIMIQQLNIQLKQIRMMQFTETGAPVSGESRKASINQLKQEILMKQQHIPLIREEMTLLSGRRSVLQQQYKEWEKLGKLQSQAIAENARRDAQAQAQRIAATQRLGAVQAMAFAQNIEHNKKLGTIQARALADNLAFDKKVAASKGWLAHQFEKFALVFSRVLFALAGFVIISTLTNLIRGFVSSLIESNQLIEVTHARLKSLIPSSEQLKQVWKDLQVLTITTPFKVAEVADAFALLKAFGGEFRRDMKSIADWAAVTNRDINDTAVAFGKIVNYSPRTGLLLSTRGLTESQLEAYVARYGDRVTALNKLIQDSFGGTAERISQTFEGLLSNISDLWTFISQKLGKTIFTELKSDLQILYELMVLLNNTMDNENNWLSKVTSGFGVMLKTSPVTGPFMILRKYLKDKVAEQVVTEAKAQLEKIAIDDINTRLALQEKIVAFSKTNLQQEKELLKVFEQQATEKKRQLTKDAGHATIFDLDMRKRIQELGLNAEFRRLSKIIAKEGTSFEKMLSAVPSGEQTEDLKNLVNYYKSLSVLLKELAEPVDIQKTKVQVLLGLEKAMKAEGRSAQDIARAKEAISDYLELLDKLMDTGTKGQPVETLKIVAHEDDLDRYNLKLSEVTEKTLEFQRALSLEKAKLYGGERGVLKQIVKETYEEIDKLSSLIDEKRDSIEMIKALFGADDPHVLIMQTDILNLRKQQIDLLSDTLRMEVELAKVSENWGDAFAKQLGKINNELEAFRDTLAASTVDFVQESGRGILNELLFGKKSEDLTDKINDLRFQLLQVQGEKAGIKIIEDQEASLLSRINELESERANIVGTILVESFQKLIDKLQELAINELLSHIIPSSSGNLGDIERKGIDVLGDYGLGVEGRRVRNEDLIIRRSGGSSSRSSYQIVFNGPVYGLDDFNRKVDEAAKRINSNLAVKR